MNGSGAIEMLAREMSAALLLLNSRRIALAAWLFGRSLLNHLVLRTIVLGTASLQRRPPKRIERQKDEHQHHIFHPPCSEAMLRPHLSRSFQAIAGSLRHPPSHEE